MKITCPSCKHTKIGIDNETFNEVDPTVNNFHFLEPYNLFRIKSNSYSEDTKSVRILGCPECGTIFIHPWDLK